MRSSQPNIINKQTEISVRTVQNVLKAMNQGLGNLGEKLNSFLTQLRQAPNSTGVSAYHRVFSRSDRKSHWNFWSPYSP